MPSISDGILTATYIDSSIHPVVNNRTVMQIVTDQATRHSTESQARYSLISGMLGYRYMPYLTEEHCATHIKPNLYYLVKQ